MVTPWRDRFAYWCERQPVLRRLVLTYVGDNYRGKPMHRNRINGHVVVEISR